MRRKDIESESVEAVWKGLWGAGVLSGVEGGDRLPLPAPSFLFYQTSSSAQF